MGPGEQQREGISTSLGLLYLLPKQESFTLFGKRTNLVLLRNACVRFLKECVGPTQDTVHRMGDPPLKS